MDCSKETPGGYLFRAPNPWLFGAGKHYLANEAQRAEILELGRFATPVYALVFALVIIACPPAVRSSSVFSRDTQGDSNPDIRFASHKLVNRDATAVASPSPDPYASTA